MCSANGGGGALPLARVPSPAQGRNASTGGRAARSAPPPPGIRQATADGHGHGPQAIMHAQGGRLSGTCAEDRLARGSLGHFLACVHRTCTSTGKFQQEHHSRGILAKHLLSLPEKTGLSREVFFSQIKTGSALVCFECLPLKISGR